MSKTTPVINAIFESLSEKSTNRTEKSLAIIKGVCDEQVAKKRLNFTIAEIGRLSQSMGGPSEQTIRNKTIAGETYRSIINAFNDQHGALKTKRMLGANADATATIHTIEDHETRIQMFELLAENHKLKKQVREYELACMAPSIYNFNGEISPSTLVGQQLDSVELKALSQFILDEHLHSLDLEIGTNGRLIRISTGDAVTKPGFIDAIRKVTTNQQVDKPYNR
jgi:hypothetical protein